MRNKITKFCTLLSVVWTTLFVWSWTHHQLALPLSSGCLTLSTLWLAVTAINLRKKLQTFADRFSRIAILTQIWLGSAITLAAYLTADSEPLAIAAYASLAAWAGIYLLYRFTRSRYAKAGHGLLPKDAWINPPAEVYQDGDITLTSGRIAQKLQNSVGHGEITVGDYSSPEPELYSFSSYMESGTVINKLSYIANPANEGGLYIVMRPRVPLTEAQKLSGLPLAKVMCEQDAAWRDRTQARVNWLFDHLPFNKTNLMLKLRQKFHVSGYDWLGLVSGRVPADHWICIVAALEHSRRRGIKTAHYSKAWGEPTNPDAVLSDPNYRLLTTTDQKNWVATKKTTGDCCGCGGCATLV
jgi:hypothetical protein